MKLPHLQFKKKKKNHCIFIFKVPNSRSEKDINRINPAQHQITKHVQNLQNSWQQISSKILRRHLRLTGPEGVDAAIIVENE